MGHRAGVTKHEVPGNDGRGWPASAHEARRFLLGRLPECTPVDGLPTDGERYGYGDDQPVLVTPELVEPAPFRAIHVADPGSVRGQSGFAAFLDGTQDLRVVSQVDGISIVWATVSAAIRARVDRRLVSWPVRSPIVSGRLYIPFRYVPQLESDLRDDPRVIDIGVADSGGNFPSRHPAKLMEAAVQSVQRERERIEQELAEAWCASGKTTLFIDGGITASDMVASSPLAVGVVKSHRRLYAEGDAFRILVGLKAGERTSVFRVAPRSRHAVASWYVRVRQATGRDALFGLVRIEAALSDDITSRADEISRWVIGEGAPLALPDGRWDKMSYGIRHTEEFLRAIS